MQRYLKLDNGTVSESQVLVESILASLQEQIAVLDQDGTIVMVNEAWIRSAHEDDLFPFRAVEPGTNFLQICQQAGSRLFGNRWPVWIIVIDREWRTYPD